MLKEIGPVPELLHGLRDVVRGSLSVKTRAGFSESDQIFSLLPVFEDVGIDFVVLHPRTVVQQFDGWADHDVTARVVRETSVPVIANGDVRDAAAAERVMEATGAAKLLVQAELTPEILSTTIAELLQDDRQLRQMAQAAKVLGQNDSAERVIAVCSEILSEG